MKENLLSVFLVLGGPHLDVLHIYIPDVIVQILVCLKEIKNCQKTIHDCIPQLMLMPFQTIHTKLFIP